MNAREGLEQVVVNPKVGYLVSVVTTLVGASFDWIRGNLGDISTTVGIILALVLIFSHLLNRRDKGKLSRLERKKLHLEIEIIEEKEAERLAGVRRRRIKGEPVRRNEDSAA